MAPLTGLSGLQCLRLSVPFWDCSWGWLRQLLRLTSILLSDCGMLIVCVSCVLAVATHPAPGQRGQAQPSQWLDAGELGWLYVYTGMGVERFDFKELAYLTVLKEATIRCAIMFHDMPAHQHTLTSLRATVVGTATALCTATGWITTETCHRLRASRPCAGIAS